MEEKIKDILEYYKREKINKETATKLLLNLHSVTKRTFKCLGCKHYDVKVINDKGGTTRVCKVKENDIRIIIDLDAPNCVDYVYGW